MDGDPEITINDAAAEYLREGGGTLYLWCDEHGLLHHSREDPGGSSGWQRVQAGHLREIRVYIAPSALDAARWDVTLHRFPRRWLEVTSDLTQPAQGG